MVPRVGFEPTQAYAHGPLKTACLPIPPPRPTKLWERIITFPRHDATGNLGSDKPEVCYNREYSLQVEPTGLQAPLPIAFAARILPKRLPPLSYSDRGKQVSLAVFANEPTARMAEQRLQVNSIPCLVRSLQGGPGLWGSAYNLPHDLLVYEQDEMHARKILDLAPPATTEWESAPTLQLPPVFQCTLVLGVISAIIVVAVVVWRIV